MSKCDIEIRQIDAWNYGEEGWVWNDSIILEHTQFEDNGDLEGQFVEFLIQAGFSELLSNCYMTDEGSVIELRYKPDDRPILAAMVLGPIKYWEM